MGGQLLPLRRAEETLLTPVVALWLVIGLELVAYFLDPNSELKEAYVFIGAGLVIAAASLTVLLVQRAKIRRTMRDVQRMDQESRGRPWPDAR